jgi:predicted MFS family arabinose efflux permease
LIEERQDETWAAGSGRRGSVLLLALSLASFLAQTSSIGMTPFLLDMAQDLTTDLAATSGLLTFSNLAWALAALAAGRVSDRFGRKPVMLFGMLLLGIGGLGSAVASDYPSMAFWRIVVGCGGGSQMPTIFATAGDLFPSARRGKVLGWIMTAQSLSLVLGAPAAVLIASHLGWRWSVASVALAILPTALAMLAFVPRPSRRMNPPASHAGSSRKLFSHPCVVALLGSVALERVCYATVVIFFATYLRLSYDPPPELLFWALALAALGNVFGNQLGGRLSDRLQSKYRLVAIAMVSSSLLAFPLLLGAPGLPISIGLGLIYNTCNAMSRPSLWWMLSDVSREARGTVMGVNITIAGIGWLIASALGGWLVVGPGFGALAVLAASAGFGCAAFVVAAGRIGRVDGELLPSGGPLATR